ncbi:MAG: hypothetical protein JWN20_1740, partial [Jatrophihabitantaceae bacterium]|nr:hypothetical protein [Jatrophihabitantaceae bacterium]
MPTLRSTTALRRGRSGIALAVLLGVAALLGPGAPSAEAAPPTGPAQGLEVTVSGWSGEPTLTLRNASSVPCQITTSDLGSAQLVVVEQGGAGLPPISAPAAIAEGLQESVTTRLVTLEPGAARTVPLTVLSDGS